MDTRATTRTRLSVLPVFIALLLNLILPIAPTGSSLFAANDGIDDYAQCQIGDGAGLDCAGAPETPAAWTNGILNDTHNDYSEDEVVPQRLQMNFGAAGNHSVTLRYMTRKDSSGQRHAYDYLATWNHTYVNADRCEDLPSGTDCIGGAPSTFPIPSDPNSVTPVGSGISAVTAAHELPQANRQFTMYGGTITGTSAITHAVDPNEDGSDYGIITVNFTVGAGGSVQLLFGGHLASGFGPRGWGEGLGAASISGGPYHIIVDAIDGESIGNRDNQIMSNAIQPLLPALTIVKTPDGGTVNAGEYASFTITVTNNGPGEATNVDIDDTLPAGTGLVWAEFPDKAECTVVSNVLHCDIASLADDASFSVTVRALTDANDCGLLPNVAYTDADNNPQASDVGDITVLCGDIEVDKTPDGGQVTAGDAASFTIVTSNVGNGTATGAALSDVLPAVANGWSIDSEDWAGDCAITGAAGDPQTLTCGPEDLISGASRSVTVTTTTTGDDCGLLDNPAANVTTTNDGSDTDDGDITVLCAEISVDKTPDEASINAGDDATFSIVTSNGGDGTAADAALSDVLPAVANGWSIDAEDWAGDCAITGAAGDPQTLTCGPEDIEAGGSRSVTVTTTTTADDCGLLDNPAADVTTSNDGSDSDDGDITVLCADISVDKTPDEASINAGDDASFTVVTSNDGDGAAYDATLSDDLPAVANGWAIDSEDWGGADCAITGVAGAVQTLTCGPEDIEAGGSRSVTVTTTTTADDCGPLDNLAEVSTSNDGSDSDTGDITVLCPDVVVDKSAFDDSISAGEDASFTIVTSNDGEGTAYDATLTDDLPAVANGWAIDSEDWDGECLITGDAGSVQTLTCGPEDLEAGGDRSVTLSTATTQDDCGLLENLAEASASNEGAEDLENNSDDATILVECPGLNIVKTADDSDVVAGDEASFTITVWNAGPGTAFDVTLHDTLPAGPVWDVEVLQGDAVCMIASSLVEGGVEEWSIDCDLGDLEASDMAGGVVIRVFADTDRDDCGLMENTAFADASNDDEVSSSDELTVRCPELVIDKVADAEVITISGPNDDLVADPSIVTWTLTYTLTDGPVTNAVITDEVPVGFEFLDASDGGTLVDGVVTWTFPTLSASGSVTFRTTVDPETISRVAPTVNVAVIDSDETEPDEGEDSVTVVVEPPPLGGTPTPKPSLPDTAAGFGTNGEPITVPVELLVAFFIGSLGAMALANVKARGRRR